MYFSTLDKIFILDNFSIVQDIKYFVRAEGRGIRAKNNFRGSFQGVRVKIENQDKTNMDFFPNSGTTEFRSKF